MFRNQIIAVDYYYPSSDRADFRFQTDCFIRTSSLNRYLLDRMVILYISPVVAFIVSLVNSPALNYFLTYYAMSIVLIILILSKMCVKKHVSAICFLPILLISAVCLVEVLHYFLTGAALNGMKDVRMVLYNPLYGAMLVFTLYATYLLISSRSTRDFHLQATVKLVSWFNVFFILYWILLFSGLIPKIESTDFLNANGISYAALFVFFCLALFNERLAIQAHRYKWYILVNVAVLFLNTTRGAIVVFFMLIGYLALKKLHQKTATTLFIVIWFVGSLALGISFVKLNMDSVVLGENYRELLGSVEEKSKEKLKNEETINIEVDDLQNYEDHSISAVTRIFTNYLAVLSFLKYPLIGAGSVYAFSLKVFHEGIHSYIYLLVVSTGLIGTLLFIFAIKSMADQFKMCTQRVLILLFTLGIFQFTNQLAPFFVLLMMLDTAPISKRKKAVYYFTQA